MLWPPCISSWPSVAGRWASSESTSENWLQSACYGVFSVNYFLRCRRGWVSPNSVAHVFPTVYAGVRRENCSKKKTIWYSSVGLAVSPTILYPSYDTSVQQSLIERLLLLRKIIRWYWVSSSQVSQLYQGDQIMGNVPQLEYLSAILPIFLIRIHLSNLEVWNDLTSF